MARAITVLDFWVADGNGTTENHLIKYNSDRGITSVQLIGSGWPSDLIRIGTDIYGIDTAFKQLYTLNPDTGQTTYLGSPTVYGGLGALAYDAANDILYSVDWDPGSVGSDLITFDRTTGAATFEQTLIISPPFNHLRHVRGLAYNTADNLLYASSVTVGNIYSVDPVTGDVNYVTTPTNDLAGIYDELTFFNGDLYAPYSYFQSGSQWVQIRLIDLATGLTTDYGPPIQDVSAHSLIVNSVPSGPILIPVPATAWLGVALLGGLSAAGVVRKRRQAV